MQVPRFPVPGETVIGQDFAEGPGGKGSNQAIAAARLGAEVDFIGRIGEDRYGDDARSLWEVEGVNAKHVTRDPVKHTGAGFVIVDEDGENEITVAPGANDSLSPEHVSEAADVIGQSDTVLLQMEIPTATIDEGVNVAATAGVPVILNPAPAREISPAILEYVDYLTPNRNEARILAGYDPDSDRDDIDIARELVNLGVGGVVMTLGADGALIVTEERSTTVAAPDVDTVDTTGAGDAFNAAFAVAIAEKRDVDEAVKLGCAAGALTTTKSEVIPGLPERQAVNQLVSP